MKYKKLSLKILLAILCTTNTINHPLVSDANTSTKNFMKSSNVDTWEAKSPISNVKYGVRSAVVDGKIYAIGGLDGSYFNKVEAYNPETDTWEPRANMPTARHCLTVEVVNGKIYCIGGYKDGNNLNVVEVYDPVTNTWETKSSMPTIRHHLTSAVVDGKIYCIGGSDGNYLSTVEVYDPSTDRWETKTSMPTARYGLTSGVVDGKIYVIGGGNGNYLNAVEVYDPTTDTWETKTSIPTPRRHTTSAVLDGKIYTIGGIGSSGNSNKVEVYTAISEDRVTEIKVEEVVKKAEQTKDPQDIEYALSLVNQLPDSDIKNKLKSRLDALSPISSSANIDVYIRPQSILSLSLDTNSVMFDEFTGIEDIVKENAINLTVESSLPYEINASLEGEIQNADGTNVLDKSVLSIKANSETKYNTFSGIGTPIILLDSQESRFSNKHGIDLMLNKNITYKTDVYKTTIKFEVKQK